MSKTNLNPIQEVTQEEDQKEVEKIFEEKTIL